eukprot:TRINITY_DN3561_c0_g1_i1.p1 TRINITY_DN3561_c0_g1~~TRINITY_DN3561_c0_g1_i1.p1  ORF type:complete len:376 (-),score=108.29 TRINITY_DN3561_c0_g1_i1:333-1460(-)
MKLALVLGMLLATMAVVHTKEVHDLGEGEGGPEAGPNNVYNSGVTDTWGRDTGSTNLNVVGPPHGNPGYKESHNWETDVDIWSPVVFNWRFYQAMYSADGLADKSEAEVRKFWMETGLGADKVYPNCQQASDQFSLNMYYRANAGLASTTNNGVCGQILNEYLRGGMVDGKPVYKASAEDTYKNSLSDSELEEYNKSPQGKARATTVRKGGNTEWTLNRSNGNLGLVIEPTDYYSYTFWFKMLNPTEQLGNILEYGNASPKISIAGSYSKVLKVYSRQTNSDSWGCNTPDNLYNEKEWTHFGVVVENKKLSVYIAGKLAVSCENNSGELQMSTERAQLRVPDDETYADGNIRNLKYWAGAPLSADLIAVEASAEA